MKFFVYTYDKVYENYCPDTVNIGDYIQSLAAAQFLPHVDGYIDRDNILNLLEGAVIGNGW